VPVRTQVAGTRNLAPRRFEAIPNPIRSPRAVRDDADRNQSLSKHTTDVLKTTYCGRLRPNLAGTPFATLRSGTS
jgi:hypothetical protein